MSNKTLAELNKAVDDAVAANRCVDQIAHLNKIIDNLKNPNIFQE